MLNQNVPLADVIRMSTVNPRDADVKRPERGEPERRLGPRRTSRCCAWSEGKFGFLDARGARADGTKMIVCELTLRNGASEWLWDLNGRGR